LINYTERFSEVLFILVSLTL